MKFEKLSDVIKNPDHPLVKAARRNEESQAGDEITCVNCSTKYIRGVWDFQNLCNPCFNEYDKKKWEARIKFLEDKNV